MQWDGEQDEQDELELARDLALQTARDSRMLSVKLLKLQQTLEQLHSALSEMRRLTPSVATSNGASASMEHRIE